MSSSAQIEIISKISHICKRIPNQFERDISSNTTTALRAFFYWCGSFFFCFLFLSLRERGEFNTVITLFNYIHHLYAVNVIHIMYEESKQIFQREIENISQFSQVLSIFLSPSLCYSLYYTLANLFMTSCCSLLS